MAVTAEGLGCKQGERPCSCIDRRNPPRPPGNREVTKVGSIRVTTKHISPLELARPVVLRGAAKHRPSPPSYKTTAPAPPRRTSHRDIQFSMTSPCTPRSIPPFGLAPLDLPRAPRATFRPPPPLLAPLIRYSSLRRHRPAPPRPGAGPLCRRL